MSSLSRGIDIQRGPPRPLDNSLDGIVKTVTPASFNNEIVFQLRS